MPGDEGGLGKRDGEARSSTCPERLNKSSPRFILCVIVKGFERGHPSSINRPTGTRDPWSDTMNEPHRSEGEGVVCGEWAGRCLMGTGETMQGRES